MDFDALGYADFIAVPSREFVSTAQMPDFVALAAPHVPDFAALAEAERADAEAFRLA